MKVTATDAADLAVFEPASALLRLLAAGLTDHALLNRLFGEQLAGAVFAEAPNIIWHFTPSHQTATSLTFSIISSAYWLAEFKYADTYEAATHADAAPAAE